MTIKPATRIFNHSLTYLLILFTLLQLIVALLTDALSLSFDEAMWHYIGRNWLRLGLTPYAGGVDNKSPLMFIIFGLSDWLFGVNYWFPRMLGTIVQTSGIYFLYKIASHFAGRKAGVIAITLYALSLLWRSTGGKYVSYTETYAMFFILLSFHRYLVAKNDRDIFLSGFIAGLGFGFRISAIFGIAALFLTAFRNRKSSAVYYLSGACLCCLLLVAMVRLAGIDPVDLYHYGITANFGPGSTTDHPFSWRLERFLQTFFYSELVLFYPALAAYFLINKQVFAITAWLIFEMAGINLLGIYSSEHFKNLLPALSLASAIPISVIAQSDKISFKKVMILIWVCFFPKIIEPLYGLKKVFIKPPDKSDHDCRQPYTQPDEYSRKKLGLWIRSVTDEHDYVLVAGFGAQVQAYSERLSPSVYFNITQTSKAKQRFFHDITLNKPAMVALPLFAEYSVYVREDVRSEILRLVAEHYVLERCMYGYGIYRRM